MAKESRVEERSTQKRGRMQRKGIVAIPPQDQFHQFLSTRRKDENDENFALKSPVLAVSNGTKCLASVLKIKYCHSKQSECRGIAKIDGE